VSDQEMSQILSGIRGNDSTKSKMLSDITTFVNYLTNYYKITNIKFCWSLSRTCFKWWL